MRAQPVRWRIARRHLSHRRHHRLLWATAIVLVLALIAGGATAATAMVWVAALPPLSKFHIHYPFQDARIYDARGDLLYDMPDLNHNAGMRMVEPLQSRHNRNNPCRQGINRIPLVLQNAIIATEDATFYSNYGFDPLSIVRAAYQNWTAGHIISGASTITQQLVRANMLTDTRTLSRKAREVVLAYEISRHYSKRILLWYYLNSVYFGNLAYGAPAAARAYFHEPVCRVDLAQSALLAGLISDPTQYDPVLHRTASLARMHTVLHLMRVHHTLHSRRQVAAAMHEARGWRFSVPHPTMRYPDFTRYVINQIRQSPALDHLLFRGVDVYTTLDPRLQNLAQTTVTQQIDGLQAQHVTDGALVSLDLRHDHYGWILAMVGGAHAMGTASQVNMAIEPRQPGSSMKPFNYSWALTHGDVSPATLVTDSPIALPDPGNSEDGGIFAPLDYDHEWHGTVTVRQALANSLNVPAVKMEYYITGISHVAQTAHDFGMTHLYADNPGIACSVCFSVTLGGLARGTRPLEETAAYGVFATGGWKVPPVAIWKIVERSTGRVLYCSEDCPKGVQPDRQLAHRQQRVLDAAHAYEMTSILADNNARCTPQVCEFGLNSALELDRPAAAKTGTTNAWTDNWTVGYTPQIVTGVWVGNADRSPMLGVNGVTGAAPIWHDYMESAFRLLNLPVLPFVPPPGVIRTDRCVVGGTSTIGAGAEDVFVPEPATPLPLCAIPGTYGGSPVVCTASPTLPGSNVPPCSGSTYVYGPTGSSTAPAPTGSVAPAPPLPAPANPVVPP